MNNDVRAGWNHRFCSVKKRTAESIKSIKRSKYSFIFNLAGKYQSIRGVTVSLTLYKHDLQHKYRASSIEHNSRIDGIIVSSIDPRLIAAETNIECCVSVKVKREDGFHVDLDDFLMGLLQLASELVCRRTDFTRRASICCFFVSE